MVIATEISLHPATLSGHCRDLGVFLRWVMSKDSKLFWQDQQKSPQRSREGRTWTLAMVEKKDLERELL